MVDPREDWPRRREVGEGLVVGLPRDLMEWDFIKFLVWMFETTEQKPLWRRKRELISVEEK